MNIKKFKEKLSNEGIEIVGIFGSLARGEADEFSDIDIAYKLTKKFFQKYKDGFSQLIRLEEIKKELKKELKKKVDLVPFSKRFKDIKYV